MPITPAFPNLDSIKNSETYRLQDLLPDQKSDSDLLAFLINAFLVLTSRSHSRLFNFEGYSAVIEIVCDQMSRSLNPAVLFEGSQIGRVVGSESAIVNRGSNQHVLAS